jgi:hypothetical protein
MYTPVGFFSFFPIPLKLNNVVVAAPAEEVSIEPIPRPVTRLDVVGVLFVSELYVGVFAPDVEGEGRNGRGGGDEALVAVVVDGLLPGGGGTIPEVRRGVGIGAFPLPMVLPSAA